MKSLTSLLPLAALATAIDHNGPAAQIPLEPSTILEPSTSLTLDRIPLLGYGTWNLKGDNISEAVSWAIQTGYRHIDGAAIYGNEKEVGKGIHNGLEKANLSREDIWVTSKLWNDHHGTSAPAKGLKKTLDDLGLEYLDLYHMHWPVADGSFGKKIEYKETWDAMGVLLERGKVRHIGVSNFSPEQLKDLLNHTRHVPSVHQFELHPYLQQNDWVQFHKDNNIHVTAYSPLGGTNPTYSPGDTVPLLQNDVLKSIASKHNATAAQVAIAWGLSRGTSLIPKSQHKERITENFEALELHLNDDEIKEITERLGEEHHRYNNPSAGWKVSLYEGLEDSKGNHRAHQ